MNNVVIVGLGKMGRAVALNLSGKVDNLYLFNRTLDVTNKVAYEAKAKPLQRLAQIKDIPTPKTIITILPAGQVTDLLLFGANSISSYLNPGDTVIDFSNGLAADDLRRSTELLKTEVTYMDCGISGGPVGSIKEPCLMLGGTKQVFESQEWLFKALTRDGGFYSLVGTTGAGHYTKMVHNAIEYGMMQAIAEGFNILKASEYNFDLKQISEVYSKGSIIQSKLISLLNEGYSKYGVELSKFSGLVNSTGEGEATLLEAETKGLDVDVLKASVEYRKNSIKHKTYTGKVLSLLRNMFGGHPAV
jgi:6-phosphogluconate dehydrogenase